MTRSLACGFGVVGVFAGLACGGTVSLREGTGGSAATVGAAASTANPGSAGNASSPRASSQGGAYPVPSGGDADDGGAPDQLPVNGCDPIVFADVRLEAAVRAELGKLRGPLTSADVAGLSQLEASSLSSLKGVECLRDLTALDIGGLPGGSVEDLSPLAGLSHLQNVSVSRNPLASLAPLGTLPNLEQIFAAHLTVELELGALADAPKLAYLDLEADTVVDPSPLGSAPTLRKLILRNGNLLHPEGISVVTSLTDLDATAVFDDVAPLATLTKLETLRIPERSITNFLSLGSLVNLRLLDITHTGVDTLVPVGAMTKLVNLQGSGNHIQEATELGQLFELNIVVLSNNYLHMLSGLVGNDGIGSGDLVDVQQNPLWCDSWAAQELEELQSLGVEVRHDCP
jgi:Leucine-rich repeat (LRR) protein